MRSMHKAQRPNSQDGKLWESSPELLQIWPMKLLASPILITRKEPKLKYTSITILLCMIYANINCSGKVTENLKLARDRNWVDKKIRFNEIQVLGSHNSYKEAVDPSVMCIIEAEDPELARSIDYSHISLTKQLELGLRKLELDLFHDPVGGLYADPYGIRAAREMELPPCPIYDPDKVMLEPGFKVLHIQDIDFRSNCLTFKRGIEEIKAWSEANPEHLPIVITMNTTDEAIDRPDFVVPIPFDEAAFDALDQEIRDTFTVDKVIVPDNIRGNYDTLEQAVLTDGWPTLGEIRGKVMFVLDEGGKKLENYTRGHSALKGRMLFINAKEGTPEAAFRIINDPIKDGEYIQRLVRLGYLVRTRADSGTEEARRGDTSRLEAALISGAQFISTDYYIPNPAFGTDYQVRLPHGGTFRLNPLFQASKSISTELE